VAKFILEWEPSKMLEDDTGVDFGVNIKNGGDSEFIPWTEEPTMRGGKYRYNIPRIPCLDTHIQLYAKNNEGISYFDADDFDSVIEASNLEAIIKSSFSVSAPTNTRFEQNNDNVAVYWEPSQCATEYQVMFLNSDESFVEKNTTESKVEVTELKQCGQYDIGITASIGDDMFSEEAHVGLVNTPPSIEAGDKIDPEVSPSANGVAVKWDWYNTLSCVSQYEVRLCHEDGHCEEPTEVDVDNSNSYVEYTSPDNLDVCSKYSVIIKPLYQDENIKEKHLEFHTLSPAMENVASQLEPVSAASGSDQKVSISWSKVKCAAEYRVYQKLVNVDGDEGEEDWEFVESSDVDTEIAVNGVPCTEYKYGVRVVIDGVESDIAEAGDTVITPLDDEEYSAPNLHFEETPESVNISWDHARCIQSYRMKICQDGSEDECQENNIAIDDPSKHNVDFSVTNLSPCTSYKMQIFAITSEQEVGGAEVKTFRTSAPEAVAPTNFQEEVLHKTNQIKVAFDPVTCAESYRVYQILEDGEASLYKETKDSVVTIDNAEPCSDFRFDVAAVVEEIEGPKTEFVPSKIPPRVGSKPVLEIDQKFNKTVVLSLKIPDFNRKCEVESYNVKYHNLGENVEDLEATIPIADLKEGKIILDNFPQDVDKGVKIEGRIKYLGFESWSPWISSQSKKPEILLEEGNGIIVPIVIGALIAVVVLVVLIFFIVRRKKSQNKYDCDKTDQSENKKLNEEEA